MTFTLAELAAVGVVRSVAGFGLGLLLADSFNREKRKRLGWTLFLDSIVLGIPVGIDILKKIKG